MTSPKSPPPAFGLTAIHTRCILKGGDLIIRLQKSNYGFMIVV